MGDGADKQVKQLPGWVKFATAAMGGCSGWIFVHPFDVIKIRMQIQTAGGAGTSTTAKPPAMSSVARGIYASEGVRGLYSGISAGIARQLTYTTMRVGLYDVLRIKVADADGHVSFPRKIVASLSAGAIAATACCPVEVSLVRLQADGALPKELRRGYSHVGDALTSIVRSEGVATLWRGCYPTVVRGAVVSMSQLSTYDQAKVLLKEYAPVSALRQEGVGLHLSASLISGFVYCFASLPLDAAKTLSQNQKPLADGSLKYTSILQTLRLIATEQGVTQLWKGFLPYFLRGGGHTVGMFLFLEQYRKMFRNVYGVEE